MSGFGIDQILSVLYINEIFRFDILSLRLNLLNSINLLKTINKVLLVVKYMLTNANLMLVECASVINDYL